MLPIFAVYTVVLILTHIGGNGESFKRAGDFCSLKRSSRTNLLMCL